MVRSRVQRRFHTGTKPKVQSWLDEKRRVEPSAGRTLLRLIGCLRTANPTQPRSAVFHTIGIKWWQWRFLTPLKGLILLMNSRNYVQKSPSLRNFTPYYGNAMGVLAHGHLTECGVRNLVSARGPSGLAIARSTGSGRIPTKLVDSDNVRLLFA